MPTRRHFLRSAAATSAAVSTFNIVPRHVLGRGFVPPSETVNIALIGCGGKSRGNMQGVMQHADARIIAVADPAEVTDLTSFYYKSMAGRLTIKSEVEKHYAEKNGAHRCADYVDFRHMLEKEKDIDAVIVSTPDHQHAHGTLAAMRLGKHVYCEKPLTHNIREARLVAKVAKETGVATQMGNAGHSRAFMADTVEMVRAGVIGDISEVHAWVPAKRWNPGLLTMPAETPPVPKGLDWNLWLGPRAERPYHPAYAPVSWRDFTDFGCGALGDFGCHDLDSATWSLDLFAPATIEALNAGKTDPGLFPHGTICYFNFPAMDRQKPVKVTWYDGGLMPELPEEADSRRSKYKRGVLFVGSKGVMLCEGAGGAPWVILNDKSAKHEKPEQSIPRVTDHYRDWLDACKGGRAALSNFEYGARLTEITLLGVLAVRLGKKLHWDHANMKVLNAPEAEEIIHGTYRKGWEVV
jgi:predicted dehydrogenase